MMTFLYLKIFSIPKEQSKRDTLKWEKRKRERKVIIKLRIRTS